MKWEIRQSVAFVQGWDRYIYLIVEVDTNREVAQYFSRREAERVLALMQGQYLKWESAHRRRQLLNTVLITIFCVFSFFVFSFLYLQLK